LGIILTPLPQTEALPKYAHPLLNRLLKSTPYFAFINAYPHNVAFLEDILEKERAVFSNVRPSPPSSSFVPRLTSSAQDKNIGLLLQAIERAPRWALKRLTATYVTLGLADIAKVVNIQSEDEVRDLILSMACPLPLPYSSPN
jgi:COP9 signalosome complex subunit 3